VERLGGRSRRGGGAGLWALVDATGFDEERARAWVLVRMMHNAMWSVRDGTQSVPAWMTTCIAVAKAVRD
jgi:streptomycin 6-kinase